MSKFEAIYNEALTLTDEERATFALRLIGSVSPRDPRSDEEWIAEIERRARRAIAGESRGVPLDDVLADIDADIEHGRTR